MGDWSRKFHMLYLYRLVLFNQFPSLGSTQQTHSRSPKLLEPQLDAEESADVVGSGPLQVRVHWSRTIRASLLIGVTEVSSYSQLRQVYVTPDKQMHKLGILTKR